MEIGFLLSTFTYLPTIMQCGNSTSISTSRSLINLQIPLQSSYFLRFRPTVMTILRQNKDQMPILLDFWSTDNKTSKLELNLIIQTQNIQMQRQQINIYISLPIFCPLRTIRYNHSRDSIDSKPKKCYHRKIQQSYASLGWLFLKVNLNLFFEKQPHEIQ